MPELGNGGQQPPHEFGRSLDEKLDVDVCDAIDKVEAVELGELPKPGNEWVVNIVTGLIVGAIFFGLTIWWDGTTEVSAGPMTPPEVTIGVDPNQGSDTE